MTAPSIVSLSRSFEAHHEAPPFAVRAGRQKHGHHRLLLQFAPAITRRVVSSKRPHRQPLVLVIEGLFCPAPTRCSWRRLIHFP